MEYRKGTVVFTNWIIEKELGEGATGRVFEIQKTDYGITTRSALKVIRVPRSSADLKAALAEGMDGQSVSGSLFFGTCTLQFYEPGTASVLSAGQKSDLLFRP